MMQNWEWQASVQHDAELGMTGISAANPNSEIALSVQT
jgi:hypothetical protein